MKPSNNNLTFNSFFAGIGGFDLAFENQGFTANFQCELNPFCQKVLKKHWPKVTLHDDITTLSTSDIPMSKVWCGGFPCQDVSVARGSKKRDGLKGQNSGLFYPFVKLIEQQKPDVVLLENVVGLLSSHNGQDFRIIIEKLTTLGYAVSWRVLNSRFFGAPQSRPRVFICAFKGEPLKSFETLFEKGTGTKPTNLRKAFLDVSECNSSGAKVAQIAYCLAATSGRHTGTDWSRTYVSYSDRVRRLTPFECEGIQGFPTDWTKLQDIDSNDPDTHRYQALGNAVSVPVVGWIAKRLAKSIRRKTSSVYTEQSIFQKISEEYAVINQSSRTQKISALKFDPDGDLQKLKWMSGGFAIGDTCIDFKATDFPHKTQDSKLIEVIDKSSSIDSKYFISPNAAQGILRRVSSQNRKLFGPLYEALIRLSEQKKAA